MVNKRLTAFLTILTLLFTLVPFNMEISAEASQPSPIPKDGKLVLFDFGYGSEANLGSDGADAYRELSTEIKDTGKTSSLMWTFPETANLNVEVHLDYQRKDWPEGADVKFRMYNGHTEDNTFVLYFYTLETDYTPISRSFITLQPGWNTVTMSRSALDTAIPLENDIGVKFNVGGWRGTNKYVYTVGSKIYIDSAYIEFPNYGETISAPTPSIENGAGYVASDLGNNNTYTLTFAEKLWNGSHIEGSTQYDIDDYVTVYERNSSAYSETTQSYDVTVNSSGNLDITFDSALDNAIYKVVANSDAIFTATGKKLAADSEYYFSVGLASVIFTATSTVPSNVSGVMANEAGFGYTINFNNDIDPFDLENMISVTEGGQAFANYTVTGDDKYVKLTFTSALQSNTTYTVTISDDFADTNGSYISGTKEFSFTTGNFVESDGVLFDASQAEYLNEVPEYTGTSFSFKHVTDGALLGDKTVKITKNIENTNPYGKDFSNKIIPDITKYSYINCLIYSPEVSGDGLSLLLADTRDSDSVFYRNTITFGWQGWKTVSLPLSEFVNSNNAGSYINKIKFDFNRNGSNWRMPSYVLVDRIWLSTAVPTSATLVSSEFEDGAFNLAADLGGDNAYTFTFNTDISAVALAKAVTVKSFNGSAYAEYTDYTLNTDGNKLNVCFSPALTGNASFNISLDLNKLLSQDYAVGSGKTEREFTVGGAPAYFTLKNSSVQNGTTVNELSEIKLVFNNNPDKTYYVPEYIALYIDGSRVYNAYTAEVSENTVTLSFNKDMTAGEYTIKILSGYTDIYSNTYVGSDEITFIYAPDGAAADRVIVFTAEADANFDILNNKYTKITDVTNLYSQTAKLAYSQGTAGSTNVDGFINRGATMNASGMKYLNILAYSPKETENTAHVVMYSDVANNQYGSMKYVLPLDWSGWKLISIPMSSFVQSDTYDALLFNIGGWSYKDIFEDGYVLFDAIWFSKELATELALSSTSFPNGYTDAAIGGEVLELTFNSTLDTSVPPTVSLTDAGGNPVTDYVFNIDEDTLTFVFGELDASTTYTLIADGLMSKDFSKLSAPVVMNFTTANDGIFVDSMSYADKTASVQIKNLSAARDASVTLVAYAISEDNVLIEKKEKSFTAVKNTTTADSVTFSATEEISEVKAFVYDENGKFLSKQYLCADGNSSELKITSQLSGTASAKVNSASVNVNILAIDAQLAGVFDAAVVEITASNGTVVFANVVKADKSGKLTYYYVFPDSVATGTYTVSVTSDRCTAQKDVSYVSKSDRDTFFGLANGNSTDSLALCIKGLKDYIGLSASSDEQIENFVEIIIANAPYDNYPEALEFTVGLKALLDSINSATWGELTALIEQNSQILGAGTNQDIASFVSLPVESRNAICQIIIADNFTADTIAAFVAKLSEAMTEYSTYEETPQYGSSSGGGGGSGTSSFPSSPAAQPLTPIETNSVFTDLTEASWAADSIMALYQSGVISDSADRKFRPNDNVTREEFVKMIVCAFAKDAPTSSHRFTDETEGAWYNSYLSAAYSLGIAKGYEDGSFGVGQNITREDMVTICSRALEAMGNSVKTAASSSFTDSWQISDYAVDYVNAMVSLGVINGMGDGSFAPKENATRAQAAKVIAKLMELY